MGFPLLNGYHNFLNGNPQTAGALVPLAWICLSSEPTSTVCEAQERLPGQYSSSINVSCFPPRAKTEGRPEIQVCSLKAVRRDKAMPQHRCYVWLLQQMCPPSSFSWLHSCPQSNSTYCVFFKWQRTSWEQNI